MIDDPLAIIYDVETNGLPLWKEPSDSPQQPHIVQLAFKLIDRQGNTHDEACVLVRPDGWEISAEMTAIHGISQESALEFGIPEREAVALFVRALVRAAVRVAHNQPFDQRIMRIALLRAGVDRETADAYMAAPSYCTMSRSRALVNLAPTGKQLAAGFRSAKNPTLTECIRFFFGEEMADAHDAKADMEQTARLFLHLRSLGA